MSEEAQVVALLVADNTTGYFGVRLNHPGMIKPYQARVKRGGKDVHLGGFATAEEAALCVARSPEGRAAAGRAASPAVPLLSEEEEAPNMPAVLKQEGAVPPMPLGAFVKEEEVAPPMRPGAVFKEEVVAPPMPPDGVVKREHEVVVKEDEHSHDRFKRQRSM